MDIAPWMIRNVPTRSLKRLIWSLVRRRAFDFNTTTSRGWSLKGNTTDWIQRSLYYFGLWEPNLSAWIERRLCAGDVFVDVGANVGYFTLLAAARVGATGKVVAIEPMPEIFRHLSEHVAGNRLQNVRLINEAAVGPGEEGEVRLYWGGDANTGSSGMLPRNQTVRSAAVTARTLASMLTDDECRSTRLIKIDVEGVEAAAVRGLCAHAGRFRDDLELVVEVVHDPNGGTGGDHLLRYMESLGFHAYVIRDDHHFHEYAVKNARRSVPVRLTHPLSQSHNIIFSRVDSDTL